MVITGGWQQPSIQTGARNSISASPSKNIDSLPSNLSPHIKFKLNFSNGQLWIQTNSAVWSDSSFREKATVQTLWFHFLYVMLIMDRFWNRFLHVNISRKDGSPWTSKHQQKYSDFDNDEIWVICMTRIILSHFPRLSHYLVIFRDLPISLRRAACFDKVYNVAFLQC